MLKVDTEVIATSLPVLVTAQPRFKWTALPIASRIYESEEKAARKLELDDLI